MSDGRQVAQVLVGVLEAYGRKLSAAGVAEWIDALRGYRDEVVAQALRTWRDTHAQAPTPADIRALLDPGAQWPSADEAWAVVAPMLGDERASVVWCAEMARAAGEVESLDPTAARMAFRAAYERMVSEARRRGERPRYYLSPGWEAEGRAQAQVAAVTRGWLPASVLPALEDHSRPAVPDAVRALVGRLRGH